MKWIIIFISIQYLTHVYCSYCSVSMAVILNLEDHDPIYIKDSKLHYPESEIVGEIKILKFKWQIGERGSIMCGDRNFIEGYSKSELHFKCKYNGNSYNLIDLETNEIITPEQLKCMRKIQPSVVATHINCAESGTLLEIGFKDHLHTTPFFHICYDFNCGSVRYSVHNISGRVINANYESEIDLTFLKDGLPFLTREGEPYSHTNQIERFSDIFPLNNVLKTALNDVNSDSYFLTKGQLIPVGDGLFNIWKRATMFYVNVAPEWQMINSNNWRHVENIARTMAVALNDDLEVITGIAEVLQMPNITTLQNEQLYLTTKTIQHDILDERKHKEKQPGNRRRTGAIFIPIETEENLIPVPKYFWKVLKYGDQYIAFITLNNPYATSDLKADVNENENNLIAKNEKGMIESRLANKLKSQLKLKANEPDVCNDICSEYDYPTVDKQNPEKGFHDFRNGRTYCCTIEDLVIAFPDAVPTDFKIINKSKVLRYRGSDAVKLQNKINLYKSDNNDILEKGNLVKLNS